MNSSALAKKPTVGNAFIPYTSSQIYFTSQKITIYFSDISIMTKN